MAKPLGGFGLRRSRVHVKMQLLQERCNGALDVSFACWHSGAIELLGESDGKAKEEEEID